MFPEDVEDIDMTYTTSFERNGNNIFFVSVIMKGKIVIKS